MLLMKPLRDTTLQHELSMRLTRSVLLDANVLLLTLLASACAPVGTATAHVTPPEPHTVDNEAVVPGSSDVVWDRIVQRLSRGFYVINNIDKASRLINVSFSSTTPQAYIDCGTTSRTFDRGAVHLKYEYPVAQPSDFVTGGKSGNALVTYNVSRRTDLEGRANLYVAPRDSGATTVTANVRYVLTIRVTGTYQTESLIGAPGVGGTMTPSSSTVSFNTNQPNSLEIGTATNPMTVSCNSLGTLENELIGYARP